MATLGWKPIAFAHLHVLYENWVINIHIIHASLLIQLCRLVLVMGTDWHLELMSLFLPPVYNTNTVMQAG